MPQNSIEIRMTGGLNNFNSPLDLFLRKRGECQSMANVDLTYPGKLRRLLPLAKQNATAGTNIHSLFVANGFVFVVDGTILKYYHDGDLVQIATGLSGNRVSWDRVGNWVFLVDGTNKKAIYTPTMSVCDWGCAIPTSAPTVADSGSGGNPDGSYYCYYRYKITLADGTIIRTALSPVGTVTVATNKIAWSGIVHSTFSGATTVEAELFRSKVGWSAAYLVTSLPAGTTTYTDDIADAVLQVATQYDETGYYPPPANPSLVKYSSPSDRLFCIVGGDAYWSEPGLYHIFMYSAAGADYENVNSVFLPGEDIKAIKLIDENLYFASLGTWRRLRGRSPDDWQWEDTAAIAGVLNDWCAVDTPFGILGPAVDGRLWLFGGLTSRPVMDEFLFSTTPDAASCHGTYDGRFYRLFYGDETNPELVIDLYRYPQMARIVQSTRSMTASFYNRLSGKLYLCDAEYLYEGQNASESVTMSFRTAEIPAEDLVSFGNRGKLVLKANTQGDNLIITPYYDDIAQTALTAISTTKQERVAVPIRFGDYRTMSLGVEITSSKAVEIEEPWMLIKE